MVRPTEAMAGAALLALALAACSPERTAGRDGVTFGAGDAVAANKAMHIIDPWPRAARTVEHGMSGEGAEAAMRKLRRRAEGEDAASGVPLVAPPAPPGAPGSLKL